MKNSNFPVGTIFRCGCGYCDYYLKIVERGLESYLCDYYVKDHNNKLIKEDSGSHAHRYTHRSIIHATEIVYPKPLTYKTLFLQKLADGLT